MLVSEAPTATDLRDFPLLSIFLQVWYPYETPFSQSDDSLRVKLVNPFIDDAEFILLFMI